MRRLTDKVRALEAREEILALLQQDRIWGGYGLADLEPPLFAECQWLVCGEAMVLRFGGFVPPVLQPMGRAGEAEPIYAAMAAGPVFAMVRPEDRQSFDRWFAWQSCQEMHRMYLPVATILPETKAVQVGRLRRLGEEDDAAVQRLLAKGEVLAYHASQLRGGVFYGVVAEEEWAGSELMAGELLAVAGTHVCEARQSVADVGNVFTHPNYRGRGLAEACTRAVCAELLLRGLQTIFLNVAVENGVARRIYERLGFRSYGNFFMGRAERRAD